MKSDAAHSMYPLQSSISLLRRREFEGPTRWHPFDEFISGHGFYKDIRKAECRLCTRDRSQSVKHESSSRTSYSTLDSYCTPYVLLDYARDLARPSHERLC